MTGGLARMTFSKTVLQVIPALDAGGAERTTVEVASAIVQSGGRALVASRGGRLEAEIIEAGGKIFHMPVHSKNPLTILVNRRRLLRLIRDERVDIVHVRSRAPAWSALWAARAANIPLVATYHGAYEAKGALKRLYNSAMVRADLVIANSAFTAASIRAQYHIGEDRLIVIPRGADLARFDPAGVAAGRIDALARGWGVGRDEDTLKLLLPARLTVWKGHDLAIEAVSCLALGNPGLRTGHRRKLQLIFAGDAQGRDDFAASLRRDVETRGVRDLIQIVGHCSDMPAAYAWSDAVLAPSTRPEAFGRVAVEAGAMARPVIAADHGGARETVVDGETGFLTKPGDAAALAAAIEAVAGMTASERRAMGARAKERIARLFSIEAMQRSTLDAYSRVAR